MLPKYFYEILGASKETEVTFEQMCSVLDVLKENGYDSIAEYLADFYNYDSWEAMASDMENLDKTLFSSRYSHNGIYNVTEDQLNAMVEKYDWLDQYLYVTVKNDGTLPVSYTHLDVYKRQVDSIRTGSHEMFVGKIEAVHADTEMLNEKGEIDFSKLDLL